jgi:3-oxoacyl-(acyl-carrier-protein) synthase
VSSARRHGRRDVPDQKALSDLISRRIVEDVAHRNLASGTSASVTTRCSSTFESVEEAVEMTEVFWDARTERPAPGR